MYRDCMLGFVFSRPCGTGSWFQIYPGLTSWAKLSKAQPSLRDYSFGNKVLTHPLNLSSTLCRVGHDYWVCLMPVDLAIFNV